MFTHFQGQWPSPRLALIAVLLFIIILLSLIFIYLSQYQQMSLNCVKFSVYSIILAVI